MKYRREEDGYHFIKNLGRRICLTSEHNPPEKRDLCLKTMASSITKDPMVVMITHIGISRPLFPARLNFIYKLNPPNTES